MELKGKKYKIDDLNVRAFLTLAAEGLFGGDRKVSPSTIDWKAVDWDVVMEIAREQTLLGIVASAIDGERSDSSVLGFELQKVLDRAQRKTLAKIIYSIERHNMKMNRFVSKLFGYLMTNELNPVLLKGQGVAQSYSYPQRRNSGDIDILFYGDEYEVAKKILSSKASKVMDEDLEEKHLQMFIGSFIVELHGSLRISLGKKFDAELDRLYERMFADNRLRTVSFDGTQVSLLEINTDVLYVFCHILHHFFSRGTGLRQVCDLCRLLYFYRNEIDRGWLQAELQNLGFLTEWKAFGALAVDYLTMPPDTYPFYERDAKWSRKAKRIMAYILSTGNMGKNRDLTYKKKLPYLLKKTVTVWYIISNALRLGSIFPKDTAMISFKSLAAGFKDLPDHK